MRIDDLRYLQDFAKKYDLDLLEVTGCRNQQDIAIAELAIMEIDVALFSAGDRLGATMEMDSGIYVAARRRTRRDG